MVLDPPGSPEPAEGSPHELSNTSEGVKTSTLNGFPVYYFADQNPTVDDCVAYLSPVLALNLGIHVSWLEFLTSSKPDQKHEDENLQNQVEKSTARKSLAETPSWCHSIIISPFLPILETPLSENKSLVNEYLTGRRLPRLPRIKHASHMRIGMVRAPSESLFHPPTKGRQAEIDSSLREFFKLPRFLAKGDVFSVQLGHGHGPIEGHQALYCSSSEANSKREHYYKASPCIGSFAYKFCIWCLSSFLFIQNKLEKCLRFVLIVCLFACRSRCLLLSPLQNRFYV